MLRLRLDVKVPCSFYLGRRRFVPLVDGYLLPGLVI